MGLSWRRLHRGHGADRSTRRARRSRTAIYSKWFDEYHKLHPDIQINYQSIGSGGGIAQLTAGTVDFGASDMPMTDEQIAEARKSKLLHFPTVLGAVVPTYNLPASPQDLKFTPESLAGIFLGTITSGTIPRIAKDNPGVKLPDRRHRGGAPFRRQRHHLHLDRLPFQGQPGMEEQGGRGHLGQLAGRPRRQRATKALRDW